MATETTTTSSNGRTGEAVIDTTGGEPEPSTDARLRALEREVHDQGRSVKTAQRSWGIFAFFALLIAVANLIAVATKLDGKSSTSAAAPAAAAAPAPATATPAPVPGKVGVTLKEFTVSPSPAQAPAGKVTFNVANGGSVKHEFVVLRTDKPAGSLLKGAEADEAGNVGEIGNLPPGSHKTLALNLKAGHYALICNLPGHYKAGQHADFNVR